MTADELNQGKVIVFSAPSGAGKTTIVKALLASQERLSFSISACSRDPRGEEVDGKDYHFIGVSEFKSKIERNAFGRQRESFQSEVDVELNGHSKFQGVFIRAPRFTEGSKSPIAWLDNEIVGVLENNIMALTFHPELTDDLRFHSWLLNEASE